MRYKEKNILFTMISFCILSSIILAQNVNTDEERQPDTQKITISGKLDFSAVFRNDFFADLIMGPDTTNSGEDFIDPKISLLFQVQLKRNVYGYIELANERRVGASHPIPTDMFMVSNRSPDDPFHMDIEQAFVQVKDFIFKDFEFNVGIIGKKYELRGDGNAFFINLRESESPFGTALDTHARGFLATYKPSPHLGLYIDFFEFITSETGFLRQDEGIFGVNIDLLLKKDIPRADGTTEPIDRLFNFIFSGIYGDNGKIIWTFGLGADYPFTTDPDTYLVEIFGESLFQFGEYGRKNEPPIFAHKDQDQLAFGGYIGFKFTYRKIPYNPFIEVSYWYLSGDDDDPNSSTNNNLVTYENVRSTLIVEENDYGMDIDSNYWAIKFKTGVSLKPLLKKMLGNDQGEEVRLEVLYAHFEANDTLSGISRRIGDEVDLKLIWEYTPDVSFSLGVGALFNSKFSKDLINYYGGDGKNQAYIIRFDTYVKF